MTPLRKILLSFAFLMLVGIGFGFNAGDYLYSNESKTLLSEQNFQIGNVNYKIIAYDGNEIFLLREGEVVENPAQIADVLDSYYTDSYYPTDAELSEILGLIDRFQESRRDNGSTIVGLTEEKLCLANLFMLTIRNGKVVDLFPCYDQESCEFTELMFCSAIGEKPFSMCRPTELIEDFKHISFASRGLDSVMGNVTEKLNNQTKKDDLYEGLVYVSSNTDKMKDYAQKIESSLFKTPPVIGTKCYYITMKLEVLCYQICGKLDLDIEAVDLLKAKSDAILVKVEKFENKEKNSETLSNETRDRLQYKINVGLREEYLEEFEPLYSNGLELEKEINETLENKISNKSLVTAYDKFVLLGRDINNSIYGLNFTNIDNKIKEYKDLTNVTQTRLDEVMVLYNETEQEKSQAELYLFYLELKGLDSSTEAKVIEIRNSKDALDENFSNTRSSEKIVEIEMEYQSIMDELNKTVESQKENIVFSKMKAFARGVNSNLNELLIEMNNPAYNDKINYSKNVPMYLSIVNFISISCLGAFIFLVLIAKMNFTRIGQIAIYLGVFFLFVIFAGGFSYGFYYYLDHTSNLGDLDEFMLAVNANNYTSIVLNVKNTSDDETLAMKECAKKVEEIFKLHNKTVVNYEIGTGCYVNGSLAEGISSKKCIEVVQDPMIYFDYSSENKKSSVSSIFIDKLTLNGNKKFYQECDIANILRVVEFGD